MVVIDCSLLTVLKEMKKPQVVLSESGQKTLTKAMLCLPGFLFEPVPDPCGECSKRKQCKKDPGRLCRLYRGGNAGYAGGFLSILYCMICYDLLLCSTHAL